MDLPPVSDLFAVAAALGVVAGLVALRARGRRALWSATGLVVGPFLLFILVDLRSGGRARVPLSGDGLSGTSLDLGWVATLLFGAVFAVEVLATLRVPRLVQWVLVGLAVVVLLHGAVVRWIA